MNVLPEMPAMMDAILTLVKRNGPMTNKAIREVMQPEAPSYVPEIDRALQKLRKEGLLTPTKRGWATTDRKPCSHCAGTGWAKP